MSVIDEQVPLRDELDEKVTRVFAGKVVRKDLVRKVKVAANVPVFVLEYLLGKYCASSDEMAIQMGLDVVNSTLAENYIRPDESEKAKARLKQKGQHRLIDKVDVRLLAREDKFWAHLANFGDKYVHITEQTVYEFERLLQGGIWAQVDLIYRADEDEATKRPFYITSLDPIQIATFSMSEYQEGRGQLTRDEWLDLLVRSVGLEPTQFSFRQKLLFVARMIPMAERNYNFIELGPWGTGKSFVYRETSPNAILISGGKTTVPQLFVHMGTGRVGLLATWDVVAFDEVAGIEFTDSSVVQMLKDYMESGSFARGREEFPAEASLVFLGNTRRPTQELVRDAHLFADLPRAMVDPAFLDRIHVYLPGWEAPKLEQRFFTSHYGFVVDYLAEALRELRKQGRTGALDEDFALGAHLSARDEKAVRKTVSGLLKILHPHGEWTRGELREYLEFGLEGRRRVKEQLKKLAAHDYAKTSFSYIERDTEREVWVEVPEQPEDANLVEAVIDAKPAESTSTTRSLTVEELVAAGENRAVEFKSSARWSYAKGDRDEVVERAIVKTIAGFMNSHGGTLLVGVDDEGNAIGLEKDYKLVKGHGRDGFENWLTDLLEKSLGKPAVANVAVEFASLDDADVCRVDVHPSQSPVYARRGQESDLFVRLNNSTRLLNTQEAVTYIGQHWSGQRAANRRSPT